MSGNWSLFDEVKSAQKRGKFLGHRVHVGYLIYSVLKDYNNKY